MSHPPKHWLEYQFSDRVEEFRKIGAEVIGASVDSEFTHLAWIKTPRKEGGLGKMNIPLVADMTKRKWIRSRSMSERNGSDIINQMDSPPKP